MAAPWIESMLAQLCNDCDRMHDPYYDCTESDDTISEDVDSDD